MTKRTDSLALNALNPLFVTIVCFDLDFKLHNFYNSPSVKRINRA